MNKYNCSFQKAKSDLLSRVVKKVGKMEFVFIISISRSSYTTRFSHKHRVCLNSTVLVWILKGAELHALVFLLSKVKSPML